MLLKTKLAASLLIASALTTTPVLAGTEAGDGVIGGQLSFTTSDASDTTTIFASGSYFVTDAIEIGLITSVSNSESGSGSSKTSTDTFAFGARGSYNFLTDGDIVPFVGLGISAFAVDSNFGDEDFAIYDIFGGARLFVSENVAIRGDITRSASFDSDFDAFDRTTLAVGIELFF